MNLYSYQEAFAASDKTSRAMKKAIAQWFSMYFQQEADEGHDPCQRIAYTVVNKITKAVFGEYSTTCAEAAVEGWLRSLETRKQEAMQLALTGGECYLKPCPNGAGFCYTLIPRNNILIFARDPMGEPVDVGLAEKSTLGKYYYTLLERRTVDERGMLTIRYRLFRSLNPQNLGVETELGAHPKYRDLGKVWKNPVGSVGLVRMKTPMVNCVDGSCDAVAVFAPAAQLIRAIDENEAQLAGEFRRGQSRVFLSRDLLDREGNLSDDLFVGLDEDPQAVGMTIFAPQLRQQSFLERKQEYLRNVESVVGLKRGMLSEVNLDQRTATEIAASQGDFSLTVMDFQSMWEQTVKSCMALCAVLARLYGLGNCADTAVRFDWGNGVLYDEEKIWQGYVQMVKDGLIAPEVALGWRFNMPADTEEQRQEIREKYMPHHMGVSS